MQIGVFSVSCSTPAGSGVLAIFCTQNQIFKNQQTAACRSVGAQMALTKTLMLFLNVLTTKSLKGMESDMKWGGCS